LGWFVGTDEVREAVARRGERELRRLMPHASVVLGGMRLKGLATLELQDLMVISAQSADISFDIPEARLEPTLGSLFIPGPTRFELRVSLPQAGAIDLDIVAPVHALTGGRDLKADDVIDVKGGFARVQAPPLLALLADGRYGPN